MARKSEQRKTPDGQDVDLEMHQKRRGRNIVMLVVLVALAVLFYSVTILKMDPSGGN